MAIVIITIAGASKLAFANALQEQTGAVKLVIAQKPKKVHLKERISRTKKMLRDGTLLKQTWYALLLRISPKTRNTLEYFREPQTDFISTKENSFPVMQVDSVNSDEVYEALKKISPDLLVVWGSKVLQPRILATAKKSINLHIGSVQKYRGILANQHAVLAGDFGNIGASVHYIAEEVDAGDLISTIKGDLSKMPRELFIDLSKRAQELCIGIATRLHAGQYIKGEKQNKELGKFMQLKHWTPEVRYKTAKKMHEWESSHLNPRNKHTKKV